MLATVPDRDLEAIVNDYTRQETPCAIHSYLKGTVTDGEQRISRTSSSFRKYSDRRKVFDICRPSARLRLGLFARSIYDYTSDRAGNQAYDGPRKDFFFCHKSDWYNGYQYQNVKVGDMVRKSKSFQFSEDLTILTIDFDVEYEQHFPYRRLQNSEREGVTSNLQRNPG